MGSLIDYNILCFVVFELSGIHFDVYFDSLCLKRRFRSEECPFDAPLTELSVIAEHSVGLEWIFYESLVSTIVGKAVPSLLQLRFARQVLYIDCKGVYKKSYDDSCHNSVFCFWKHDHTVAKTKDDVFTVSRHFETYFYLSLALLTVPTSFGEAVAEEEESNGQFNGEEKQHNFDDDEGKVLNGFGRGFKVADLTRGHLFAAQRFRLFVEHFNFNTEILLWLYYTMENDHLKKHSNIEQLSFNNIQIE